MYRRGPEGGFTFVEILITLVFLSIAMLAVTFQFPFGLKISEGAEDLTLGTNLAQELMEEIKAMYWEDPDSPGSPLGPDALETGREYFDDVDDYDGLVEAPPHDLDGNPLDGLDGRANFGKYTRDVVVTYADTTSLQAVAGPTSYKRIEVGVTNTLNQNRAILVLILARY